MKIKTFTFEDNTILKYNRNYDKEQFERAYNGEYYYIKNIKLIDNTINNFLENYNVSEIIDIKINRITKGNNPPTSILIYTIVYKEMI